jgi:hypothetical protein
MDLWEVDFLLKKISLTLINATLFITIETGYYTQLLFAVFNIKLRFMPHMKVIYTEHV